MNEPGKIVTIRKELVLEHGAIREIRIENNGHGYSDSPEVCMTAGSGCFPLSAGTSDFDFQIRRPKSKREAKSCQGCGARGWANEECDYCGKPI